MAARKRKKDPAPAKAPDPPPGGDKCAIVGLGASAGGVEALRTFFTAMPADSGLAFIVLMHSDPSHASMLPDLLGRRTAMPVQDVKDGTPLSANQVYVVPPGKYALMRDNTVKLQDPPPVGPRIPIDTFFRSLATECNERAIGIVLSGTGREGALGLKEIRAHGGMTLAQSPETAEHAGMPHSAVATGAVDFVLPIEEMPARLLHYARHPYLNHSGTPSAEEAPDNLTAILNLVRTRTQRNYHRYKKSTLRRRIERRMGLNHVTTLPDYLSLLRTDPAEVVQLSKDLLIGVTSFFREPEAWETLARDFLRPLLDLRQPGASVRAWVPGCATGEEPYSLAIVLHELLPMAHEEAAVQIFATDVNEDALAIARAGIYPLSIAADVKPERLKRFFIKLDDSAYQISKGVRESIAFAIQDLTNDPPFSKLDLIVCRNLLIYLEPDAQKRVIGLFHFALKQGGGLFLGTSEGINRQEEMFEPASKKWHIYRRIGPVGHAPLNLAQGSEERPAVAPPHLPRRQTTPSDFTRQLLLESFAPAAVLVDRHHQILSLHGPTSRYLQPPSGEPTMELTAMVHDELGTKVRAALHHASRDNQPVTSEGIHVRRNGGDYAVRLTVRPVKVPTGLVLPGGVAPPDAAPLFLVTFEDQPTAPPAPPPPADTPAGAEALIRHLEEELQTTRENLQSTIEEVETSNEELKASNEEIMSVNEELQSTNEELETAKEELQSLNEELNTLNAQLRDKVEELEGTNNDLNNLLACTDIATVFLDEHFCIKRFTPAATRLINLIPSDVGRPLSDIARKFTDEDLLRDAQRVLDRLVPVEKEVRVPLTAKKPDRQGDKGTRRQGDKDTGESRTEGEVAGERWYIRRILPYRTKDNRIEGVVVTFVEVTPLRQAMEQTRLRARQQSTLAALIMRALQGEEPPSLLEEACRAVAEALEIELVGVLRLEPSGRELKLEAGVGWKPGMVGLASLAAGSGESQPGLALMNRVPVLVTDQAGERRFPWVPLLAEHGALSGVAVVIQDEDGPYGVLAAHARSIRTFNDNDANFLQTTANVLSQALERHRREKQLRSLNATLEQRVAERTGLVRLLQDVAVAANEAETVEAAMRYALRRVCEYNSWSLGQVLQAVSTPAGLELVPTELWYSRTPRRFDGFRQATMQARLANPACLPGQVLETRAVRWARDITEAPDFPRKEAARQEGLRGAIAFPVLIGRELTHLLEFYAVEAVDPEPGLLEVMAAVGTQIGRVVERNRLQAQLSEAVWLEQRHLGQELHDTVGQELAGLALIGKSLADRLDTNQSTESERAKQLAEGLKTALGQVRNLAQGLFPSEVDEAGLVVALGHLATQTQDRYKVDCTFESTGTPVIQNRQALVHLFYIAREGVANAAKHAQAKHIQIRLEDGDGRLRLAVQDDGVGMPSEAAVGDDQAERRQGMGLRIMRYRAALIGADLEVGPVEGGGTVVRCTLRQEGSEEQT
jgi:two-component system CheB/CheR fusion protein